MGFRPEPTIYNLNFQGTSLDGLHVRMSCASLSEYNEMMHAAFSGGEPDEDGNVKLNKEMIEANDRVLELFANHLVSWDLEDLVGQPVPTSRSGMDSQERVIISQLLLSWQIAMVNIPNLSKKESSNGSQSVEESLGLGDISQSPPS